MADDDGPGNVIDLPLVRLADPPPLTPPDPGDDPPEDTGTFPVLPSAPAAAPPSHLFLPDPVVPGGEGDADESETDPAPMVNAAVDPSATPARNVAAMTMVLAAGIAVAALRGAFHVAEYLKARAEHHKAVAEQFRTATGGEKGRSRIPSGPEFGRSARENRGRPMSPRSAGPPRGTAAASRGVPAALRPSGSADRRPSRHGSDGLLGGRRGRAGTPEHRAATEARRNALRGSGRPVDGRAPAHRQGPGIRAAVRDRAAGRIRNGPARRNQQADRTPAGSGSSRPGNGRRTLPDAMAREARRRLKKRRRNLDPPVLSTVKRPTGTAGKGKPELKKPDAARADLVKKAPAKRTGGTSPVLTPGGKSAGRPWHGRTAPTTGPKSGGRRGRKKDRTGRKRPGSRTRTRRTRPRRPRQQQTPPGGYNTPRTDGEWLRPPPGWRTGYTVTAERADRPTPGRPPAAVTTGQRALPAAPTPHTQRPGTTAPPSPSRARTGGLVTAPVKSTQYTDSELTVYDVIDADADMAQEILAGADHARVVAEKCEAMTDRLEALYAKILDLKVPGLLAGMVVRLMEKAETVKNRAEAVAAALPRASEAIAAAGEKAAAEDKHVADAVRDAGHVAPAEREYHEE